MNRLAERLARGEEAAFAELYDACARQLHAWLASRLDSPEDASDVVQETFLRLVRGRRKLGGVEDLTAYAFVVARNECYRHAKNKRRRQLSLERYAKKAMPVDDAALQSPGDLDESLAPAVAALEPHLREVIELRLLGELTFAQIAAMLGIPQGTAATRYRTALERLRGMLKKELT